MNALGAPGNSKVWLNVASVCAFSATRVLYDRRPELTLQYGSCLPKTCVTRRLDAEWMVTLVTLAIRMSGSLAPTHCGERGTPESSRVLLDTPILAGLAAVLYTVQYCQSNFFWELFWHAKVLIILICTVRTRWPIGCSGRIAWVLNRTIPVDPTVPTVSGTVGSPYPIGPVVQFAQ